MTGPIPTAFPVVERFLPGSYALHMLALAERWGVTSEELFGELGLDQGELETPESQIDLRTIAAVIQRTRALTGEPGLGILFGLETRASTYGYLTFATMCASTLGQCIDLAVRFSPSVTNAYRLRLNRSDGIAAVVVDEECDLGEVRDVILLGLLIGMRTIGCMHTGRDPWRPIDVAMPEPPYYRRFAHLIPELRFDQPISQIIMTDGDLELPLLTPDRAALRLAVEQCERNMMALGLNAGIEQRVLQLLLQDHCPSSFEKIASVLHLSPRTLKRRLAESGVTFSSLLEKARRERALLLLRSPDLSLDDVAERLGYSTVSNLVRAFRRWMGMTPAAYRRAARTRSAANLAARP